MIGPDEGADPGEDRLESDHDRVAPDSVHDRESFLIFVGRLAAPRRASVAAEEARPSSPYGPQAGGWENVTIEGFLEAARSWADDAGTDRRLPEEPTWRGFAAFLHCGKIYE